MWVFLNDAFLSIVADRHNKDNLLVRARFKGDIESVFGSNVPAIETPDADYLFRASLDRSFVTDTISRRLLEVNYDNFKNGVGNIDRHDHYMRVWSVMYSAQKRGIRYEWMTGCPYCGMPPLECDCCEDDG